MPYNPNIPQPTDIPAQSQPQLLANFQAINTLVNVNHVNFDDPDQGKHKWVSLPDQIADPVTTPTEVAIYGFSSSETSKIELAFKRATAGPPGEVILMTERNGTTNGWTMLPSGLLMKWGTNNATGATNINANAFGKAFTTLYTVQLTNQTTTSSSDTYVMGGVIVGTTFNIYVGNRTTPGTDATANINWLVIGV